MRAKAYSIIAILILALFAACGKQKSAPGIKEDPAAKKMLQGLWLDEDAQAVAFKVEGDSIFYPDSTSMPAHFWIYNDTLYMQNQRLMKYKIVKQAPHLFIFINTSGDHVRLVKTTEKDFEGQFSSSHPVVINLNQTIKRDTMVNNGVFNYHLYTQVNPGHNKVVKQSYNDEGVEVDNAYWDNSVNITIYRGAERVFSHNFHKEEMRKCVPSDFLSDAVLSDIVFDHVEKEAVYYTAILGIPDESTSYLVSLRIGFNGKVTKKLAGS